MLTCSGQSTQKNSYIVIAYQRFKLKFAFACNNNANDKNEYQSFGLCQALRKNTCSSYAKLSLKLGYLFKYFA